MKKFFTAFILLASFKALAVLPTYNPSLVPAVDQCQSGILLKRQSVPDAPGGDPKLRPKGYASGYAEIDPIKHSASHLHVFSGPCQFDINSDRASLLNSTSVTTYGGEIDKTLVWEPALINTQSGAVLKPQFTEVYYSRAFQNATVVEQTPKGLVFITGNHLATDYTQNDALAPQRGVFQCSAVTSGPTGKQDSFPLCATNAILQIKLLAPNCVADDGTGVRTLNNTDNALISINGKIYVNNTGGPGLLADGKYYIVGGNAVVDSADHKSHLEWPKTGDWTSNANECPATHPHRIVQNALIVGYKITNAADVPYLRLSSDDGTQGASAHWDYLEAWHRMFYDIFYTNCIQAGVDCGNTKLGNGWQLVNGTSPADKSLAE